MSTVTSEVGHQAAIAPDGSSIVFADSAGDGLELRRKRREESGSVPIPGTRNGQSPFFSPDGRWIGYLTADGRIRKLPATGGGSVDVGGDANSSYLVATWMDDGTIVYVDSTSNISRASSDGGRGQVILPLAALAEQTVTFMAPLPDSRGVLLTLCPGNCRSGSDAAVLDLRTDSVRVLASDAAGAWYAPTGHLLYTHARGGLYAVEFDLDELRIIGGASSVIEGVSPAEFNLARSGAALYSTGPTAARAAELVWVGRKPLPDGKSMIVLASDVSGLGLLRAWLDGSRRVDTLLFSARGASLFDVENPRVSRTAAGWPSSTVSPRTSGSARWKGGRCFRFRPRASTTIPWCGARIAGTSTTWGPGDW